MFQKANLIPFLHAVQNVQIALEINDTPPRQARHRALELMGYLGVAGRAHHLPDALFVWSYLTDGDPAYTLVQVAVNDLIMLVAITPFGPGSGAALATVVGVLVEVPVMLSVCTVCNRTRHWFGEEPSAAS